jgi:hypothetical protein
VTARLLPLALLALLAAVLLVPGAQSRGTSNSVTFTDATGEDPAAADITKVTVSNDDVGNVTFKVAIAGKPPLSSMGVDIFIDTDNNALTGPNFRGAGTEVFMRLATQNGNGTFVWNGTQLAPKTLDSYSANYADGVATFSVNTRDLGNQRALRFTVETLTIVPVPPGKTDFAPDSATSGYSYDVNGQNTMTAGVLRVAPKPAKANHLLVVSLPLTDNTTNAPLASGRVICQAKIGIKSVGAGSTLGGGIATCRFNIPKSALGKRIKGSLAVDYKGTVIRRTFASAIR